MQRSRIALFSAGALLLGFAVCTGCSEPVDKSNVDAAPPPAANAKPAPRVEGKMPAGGSMSTQPAEGGGEATSAPAPAGN